MNASFPCNLPPFISPTLGIPEAVGIIQATIAVAAAVVSAPINIYLFAVILKNSRLHQRSLFLSLQIIGIEILYHLTVPVVILVSAVNGQWVLGEVICGIIGVINDGFAMFRFSMTFVLALDRFLSVYSPFFYTRRGGLIAWYLSGTMWLLTALRVLLPLAGILDCYVYVPTFKTCTVFPGCSDSCESFAALSFAVVVMLGVVVPIILHLGIFYIIRKITRYHLVICTSVFSNTAQESEAKKEVKLYTNFINSRKRFVTGSILLTSILGTVPAFTLYMATLFLPRPSRAVFIINMLVGRTSFNIIPLLDGIAFTRHQDIKTITLKIYWSMKEKLLKCL